MDLPFKGGCELCQQKRLGAAVYSADPAYFPPQNKKKIHHPCSHKHTGNPEHGRQIVCKNKKHTLHNKEGSAAYPEKADF